MPGADKTHRSLTITPSRGFHHTGFKKEADDVIKETVTDKSDILDEGEIQR